MTRFGFRVAFLLLGDLSEIRRGVGILNLGSEMRWDIPAMEVKFANPPLELGLMISWPSPCYINDKIYFSQYTRVSQYYENSKYISNLFFVMLYTYILDHSN